MTLQEFTQEMLSTHKDLELVYKGASLRWVACRDDKPIASISLNQINPRMRTGQIGYQVSPDYRRQGVGTQIVSTCVRTIFAETDLRRLTALVAAENIPSCKILERAGFQREGRLREHFLIDGVPTDEWSYGLLRSDISRKTYTIKKV